MPSQDRPVQGAPATMAGAPWRPLLSGPLQELAFEAAHLLVSPLDDRDVAAGPDASLSSGSAGLAVCHAALARAGNDSRAADLACARLDQAVEVLAAQAMSASLYAGFTGIAWAAQIVDRLLGDEDEDRDDGIDQALARWLQRYPGEQAPYDLIHGLVGLGVYALARWPRPGAVECLTRVVDQLTRHARHDEDGTYWWTPPALLFGPRSRMYPEGGVDLGVAHGMGAVIPLLARARALGVAPDAVVPLLDGAVRWLSAQLLETPAGPTLPAFVAAGTLPEPARTAWCYGDPGVATALLLAAADAGEPRWRDLGIALGRTAAVRPLDRTGVSDAGLCHGSAGLAHLFNRMHQLTGIPEFAATARGWVERTLAACIGSAAQDPSRILPSSVPCNGAGVLEGAAGIALALLAAARSDEPLWDPMFLVSTAAQNPEVSR